MCSALRKLDSEDGWMVKMTIAMIDIPVSMPNMLYFVRIHRLHSKGMGMKLYDNS